MLRNLSAFLSLRKLNTFAPKFKWLPNLNITMQNKAFTIIDWTCFVFNHFPKVGGLCSVQWMVEIDGWCRSFAYTCTKFRVNIDRMGMDPLIQLISFEHFQPPIVAKIVCEVKMLQTKIIYLIYNDKYFLTIIIFLKNVLKICVSSTVI